MVHYIRGEHRRLMKKLAIFSVLFIFLISATWGDTYTWTGGGITNDWEDEENWNNDTLGMAYGYPSAGDDVIIDNDTVVLDTLVTIASLEIKNGGTFDIDGNSLSVNEIKIDDGTLILGGIPLAVTTLEIGTSGAEIDTGSDDLSVSGMTTLDGELELDGDLNITNLTAGTNGKVTDGMATVIFSMNGATVTVDEDDVRITGASVSTGILNVGGRDVFITAGAVTQTGAITTTKTLELNSSGAITLNSAANSVAKLKVTSALGTVEFTNNAALEIAGVSGLTGAPIDQIVKITTTGTGSNITQSGAIITIGMLVVDSSSAITLNGVGNNVATLKITGAGGTVGFTNSDVLEVVEVDGVGNNIVTIKTENGDLTAGTIAKGSVTLQAEDGDVFINDEVVLINSLTVIGDEIVINANITTTGIQTYTGDVTLGDDITFTADENNLITFESTIDSDTGNAYTLTITNADVQFDGEVGGTTALESVSVDGTATIKANIITATPVTQTTTQHYHGPVLLDASVTFNGRSAANAVIQFYDTVDGMYALTITDANVQFDKEVGGDEPLNSVTVGSSAPLGLVGTTTINANITTDSMQKYGDVVLGTDVTLDGDEVTLDTITGDGNSLTIKGTAYLLTEIAIADNVTSITVDGTAELSDSVTITTSGNQKYGGITLSTGPLTLTSTGGKVEIDGDISITTDPEIIVSAQTGINIENDTSLSGTVTLSNGNSNPASNIVLKSESTNTLDFTVKNDSNGGEISIECSGILTIAGEITSTNGIIELKGENGVNINDNISTTLTIKIEADGANAEINIDSAVTIECESLALITEDGNVVIDGTIKVSSDEDEDEIAAVYILANGFSGDGPIILSSASGGVCVTIDTDTLYIGDVTGDRIHYHYLGVHILYSKTDDPIGIPNPYKFINSDNVRGTTIYAGDNFNIYIVGVGNLSTSHNIFNCKGTGFIEIRGIYTADSVVLNAGTGGIRLNDATIVLNNDDFDAKGKLLTLDGSTGNSIEALNIILDDGIEGAGKHITLSASATGSISVPETVGAIAPLGDIEVVKGNVTFNKNVFANSYTQIAGSVTILADHNYHDAFSLTNSDLDINNASIITNNTNAGITITGNAVETTITGDVVLDSHEGNGDISLFIVKGTGNLEMKAGTGTINISGQVGEDDTHRVGNLIADAEDVNFGAASSSIDIFAADVSIINSGDYLQYANITANSFKQEDSSGTGTVSLNGDINVTATNPANAKIEFASAVAFAKALTFSVPATGGSVDFAQQGVSGDFQLTLSGGSSDTAYLELIKNTVFKGDIVIFTGSYVKVSSGMTITQESGKKLTLQANSVLDFNSSSWHIGASATSNDFAGIDGSLILGTGSKLISNDVNLTGSTFTVSNIGWATISAKGDVDIGANVAFTGDHPYLILEMAGSMQTITTAQPLGSLHIKSGSTSLTGHLTITGEVEINYPGVLYAGSYNIIMQAGLNNEPKGVVSASVGRWKINSAPQDITGGNGSLRRMFAFLQDDAGSVTFEKLPSSTGTIFFEIIGNTVWQKFICHEPEAVIQFSTDPDQHVFLNTFEITLPDGTPDSNYILLTRLPPETNWIYKDSAPVQDGIRDDYVPINAGLPLYPASQNLKNESNNERKKFWNFNLIPSSGGHTLMSIRHVTIYFSHAWYQRVPIDQASMKIKAVPFHSGSDRKGFFNYDWIQVRRIIYSYAEDGNGNGKVDRIRVQTNVPLNGEFDGFRTSVEGYKNDPKGYAIVYDEVDPLNREEEDRNSFYIYLEEGPWLYNGHPLSWRITRNDSLKDTITKELKVGEPDGEIYRTINTIPPRVSFALTLPGHNQTYVKISQPVSDYGDTVQIVGNKISPHLHGSSEKEKAAQPPYLLEYNEGYPIKYKLKDEYIRNGILSYLIPLDIAPAPSISDLANLPPIGDGSTPEVYFTFSSAGSGLKDLGVRALDWRDDKVAPDLYLYYPSPRYPIDWNYSGYKTVIGNGHIDDAADLSPDDSSNPTDAEVFTPPNRILTPGMVKKLHDYAMGKTTDKVTPDKFNDLSISSKRRSTDVLVSMTPTGGVDSDNYFAWPVWARYKDASGHQNPGANFWGQQDNDNGIIWAFDGTKNLEDRDFILQARINEKLTGFNGLSLFYGYNVPIEWREPAETGTRGKGSGGLWLPYTSIVNPLFNINPLYNIVPSKTTDSDSGRLTFYPAILDAVSSSSALYTFDIKKDKAKSSSGGKIDFILRLDGGLTTDPHLFIARLDTPAGANLNNLDWWNRIRPFSFDIQNIRLQRGGVTILNNVINSNNREVTYIRYHLVRSGRVTIQVYTLDGTLVKSLRRNEQRNAGEWTDTWDGTNNGGRPVARGMYFVRVVGPDIDEIRKIMVVK